MSFSPPTADELMQVEDLRSRLISSGVTCKISDVGLLRFLRGRERVMDNAYRAIVRHAQWREEHGVDTYSDYDIANEKEKRKAHIYGTDKNGRPLIYVYARRHKTSDRDIDEIHRFIIAIIEEALSKALPHEERIVIVFDLAAFSFDCMDYEAVKILITVLQYNYPESLDVVHIINEPWIFKACWAIISGWLHPVTAKKVNFIRQAELQKFVHEESIPDDVQQSLP